MTNRSPHQLSAIHLGFQIPQVMLVPGPRRGQHLASVVRQTKSALQCVKRTRVGPWIQTARHCPGQLTQSHLLAKSDAIDVALGSRLRATLPSPRAPHLKMLGRGVAADEACQQTIWRSVSNA
jgi:hypothetical protein